MNYSYTTTESRTFTVTHAIHIASKVATDLKRMQRFYGAPSEAMIGQFETEIIEFLRHDYLESVYYGFKRNGQWIEPTLKYKAKDLSGLAANDDDPGRIRPNANIAGASFCSFLIRSSKWDNLTEFDRTNFERGLPFQRTGASEPTINGYLKDDRTYSSGGRALFRSTVRSY